MKILDIRVSAVDIEDDAHYRSTVFLQGNGRYKCLRCDRLRCAHVQFVQAQHVEHPIEQETDDDYADLIEKEWEW